METRTSSYRRVSTWFASRWRNHQFKRAEKPHSKFSGRKALDGPATRPMTPLAVENSVGKLAAPHRGRAQCQHGKESMANSHPPFSPCSAERSDRDFMRTDLSTGRKITCHPLPIREHWRDSST